MSSSMSAMGGETAEWPFYTQAGFSDQNGEFATSFKEDTGATLVSWSPTVEGVDQSVRWGLYSTTYYPAWAGPFEDSVSSQIEPYIFERWTLGSRTSPVEGPGPFLPMWQTVPVTQPQVSGRVNLDLLSDKVFADSYHNLMGKLTDHVEGGHTVAQTMSQISLTNVYGAIGHDDSAEVGPTSMLLTPILADIHEHSSVVGVLTAVVPWTVFLEDILANQNVTVVVQSQGCERTSTSKQDTFTFNVVGDKATYVGQGDLHEEEYSEEGITEVSYLNEQPAFPIPDRFNRRLTIHRVIISPSSYHRPGGVGESLNGESESTCHHTMTVYPNCNTSSGAGHDDSKAAIWLVVVIVIILLCAVVFFMYDYQLRLKHRQTQERADRTNAIISSLYPAEIRDRLLGRKPKNRKSKNKSPSRSSNDDSSSDVAKSVKDVSSKQKLKSYLKDEDEANAANAAQESAAVDVENMDEKQREILKDTDMYETKPIAELFPNTTVMFADLAGFTAWSSVREPSQVFTLLEAVYGAFDQIAKRRRVFKVETVGDCYVAVTGLPEPRKDHALAMARFAKECIDKFNDISKQLELTLGPDTADLAVRAGIHSGPVTAGVLRGDKSRFQLFGATVNTAARVEATGMRNRVHMSSVTAQQLVDCGKEHWVKKRAEVVTAKGKGEMQTYWLVKPGDTDNFESQDRAEEMAAKVRGDGPEHLASATVVANSTNMEEIEASLPPKIMRLVGWNVEILKKSLQAIVAKRNATNTKRNYDAQVAKREAELVKKNQLLGEVCEVISLPKFDAKAHKNQEPPNKVVIPDEVVKELRLFVSSLAASHRDVPFHNFEHASHVTMSVTKLLSRIVAPSEILDTEDDEDDIAAALHDHTFGITSDPLTQFAVILSALIHDVDHYGVSNMQLVKEDHALAKQFHGKSVAEQNSLVLAWEKLMSPQFANLRRCIYTKPEDLDRLRAIVVNNVMATDIFDKDLNAIRRSRWEKAFAKKEDGGASMGTGNREQDINRKATVVMERLLQASDVSHTMQHWVRTNSLLIDQIATGNIH
eukprot:CAMPEP_0113514622 /NCGR_PEP_ID=MMETSP0014_2-20120614/40508_1 /TAXON_ID=2857 /ORGANISM="Nitzschia sp." /LENGTH=1043 /DNA_ID=CAMNT_0000411133 /DNA_START=100 /DNA_END=3233 /DNA_ORIENTATION=- /assembly_acc=CAM_ASM_000159